MSQLTVYIAVAASVVLGVALGWTRPIWEKDATRATKSISVAMLTLFVCANIFLAIAAYNSERSRVAASLRFDVWKSEFESTRDKIDRQWDSLARATDALPTLSSSTDQSVFLEVSTLFSALLVHLETMYMGYAGFIDICNGDESVNYSDTRDRCEAIIQMLEASRQNDDPEQFRIVTAGTYSEFARVFHSCRENVMDPLDTYIAGETSRFASDPLDWDPMVSLEQLTSAAGTTD